MKKGLQTLLQSHFIFTICLSCYLLLLHLFYYKFYTKIIFTLKYWNKKTRFKVVNNRVMFKIPRY